MKETIRAIIECFIVMTAVFMIIHRHVFSACLTGSPMPEAPAWHRKFMGKCAG